MEFFNYNLDNKDNSKIVISKLEAYFRIYHYVDDMNVFIFLYPKELKFLTINEDIEKIRKMKEIFIKIKNLIVVLLFKNETFKYNST
ncbi:MAG: hypothetical protein ABIL45_04420 [candidate division WOR-3 bacterium]